MAQDGDPVLARGGTGQQALGKERLIQVPHPCQGGSAIPLFLEFAQRWDSSEAASPWWPYQEDFGQWLLWGDEVIQENSQRRKLSTLAFSIIYAWSVQAETLGAEPLGIQC